MKRPGPTVTVKMSCFDCSFESSAHYACQGDSGSSVHCNHPGRKDGGYIGDTNWTTPTWCPLKPNLEIGQLHDLCRRAAEHLNSEHHIGLKDPKTNAALIAELERAGWDEEGKER